MYIVTPTTWNPNTNVHAMNEDSMLDWEGNIMEKREWASRVILEDVEDHIDASSLIISAIDIKAIGKKMVHHECEEEEIYKHNLPQNGILLITGY